MPNANVELTDTFGGDANYSWVKRATISTPEFDTVEHKGYGATVMRRAKAAVGITGMRGRKEEWGGTIAFYPYRTCMVMFISWDY